MIDAEKTHYTISRMCRLLGVDRRRYYEWRQRKAAGPTAREQRMAELVAKVKVHHEASEGTYGAPRILHDLREAGETVSVKTVAKAMRQAEIAGISPRTWHPPTTTAGPNPDPAPDLVGREFDKGQPNIVWHSDITYLATGQDWGYLCTIRDGHTRRVLGRAIADHLRADLVEDAMRQAVALRGYLPGTVIFHADRGCQYTSDQIARVAGELGLLRSMGRTGVCWDNAAAESFWSTLKNEYYHRHVFGTIAAARRGVYAWIDGFYNARRRHSSIGYISPLQYETHLARQADQTALQAA